MKADNFFARFVLLMIILSTIVTTGCEFFVTKEVEQTTENSQKEVINHEPQDLIDGLVAKMQAAGYEEMKVTAEFFVQAAYISSVYDYQLEIIDGKIYLHGYVFDDIIYVNNHEVEYKDTILEETLKYDKEKYDILLKIQSLKGCYILKPQHENAIAFKIAVYEIDNSYYFLEYYYDDVEVTKIHKVIIN